MKPIQRAASATAERLCHESPVIKALQPLYEATLWVLSRGRGLRWSVNGIPCPIDAGQRARVPREYEPEVARFLGERVRAGAVSLDVGANVGVYVLQFAHWSRPGGRVFAFEPNPAARAVLERHIRFNGLEERVEVVPCAVGSAGGRATLFAAGEDGMSRLGTPSPMLADQADRTDVACDDRGPILLFTRGVARLAVRRYRVVRGRGARGRAVHYRGPPWARGRRRVAPIGVARIADGRRRGPAAVR